MLLRAADPVNPYAGARPPALSAAPPAARLQRCNKSLLRDLLNLTRTRAASDAPAVERRARRADQCDPAAESMLIRARSRSRLTATQVLHEPLRAALHRPPPNHARRTAPVIPSDRLRSIVIR